MPRNAAAPARRGKPAPKSKTRSSHYIDIKLPLHAETLRRVDAFCKKCKPKRVTRAMMLRLLVETGIIYWDKGDGGSVAKEE
jgi:hypothetical protein